MTKRSQLKSVDEEYEEEEPTPQVEPLKAVSINEILDKNIPPIRYIIPNILHEGVCIVASPPKTGKSRLVLAVAIRMAKKLTGGIDGEVLYLSLDDASERRLQDRARGLLQGEEVEDKVWIAFESASIGKGLEKQLEWWMEDHPDTRLVIIDVFGHVKPRGKSRELYMNDTAAMKPLRELALKHHIAIQLVHHTRKAMDKDDPMSNISGTNGLWGGADQGWMLSRDDSTGKILLYVKGREPYEGVLEVDLEDIRAPWNEVGWDDKAAKETETTEDRLMIELLNQGCAIGPKRLSELTGINIKTIGTTLRRMIDKGLITQTSRGAYSIPELLNTLPEGKPSNLQDIHMSGEGLKVLSQSNEVHTNSGKPICPMCLTDVHVHMNIQRGTYDCDIHHGAIARRDLQELMK